MISHTGVEATADNDWASWFCDECDQPCTSHNPCDCCWDDIAAEREEEK